MDHQDHVALLREGVDHPGGVWADMGSGRGAFTLALAELLDVTGTIYSIDREAQALRDQERSFRSRFPGRPIQYITADFSQPLQLPPLDGLVMANSLHFTRHKQALVMLLKSYLKPGGRFILVEYNVDQGNPWVPHPISFPSWQALARRCGFEQTRLLASRPSRFLKEIYSALSH